MIPDPKTKFVFFGTPKLSAEILEHLKQHSLVPSLVVTNPDRPQGRKMLLTPPPVKMWAIKNKIPFLQPELLSDPDFLYTLNATPYTLFVVVAYGKIIPKSVLAIPSKGTLNIHYSLLPKYRGASPIESAILNDDRETGVAILLLDEKMDHGPIVATQRLENYESARPNVPAHVRYGRGIMNQEWPMKASELRGTMNKIAGKLLAEVIPRWVAGEIKPNEQDHSKATYAGKFTKNDGLLDLNGDAYKNFLKIRAFDDTIGTHFFADTQGKKIRVIVKDAEFREGKLILTRVLPEGKKEMSYGEFERGLKV
ncbi:MAG: methionyl-tRNA formyltransferase [bacterium]|nr:methionyl-tRNA formyltransferase [bacterium]